MDEIMLDSITFILPFILIAFGEGFENTALQFFGGTAALFAGLYFTDPIWLLLIFVAIGLYYILTPIWSEMQKGR